ncbi:Endonuclease/exonuclease/phosphatase [Trypanosoma melophagium]|uniref:Endonuclease/exonuclease/phosphatase n=1 Tax=Trypanosoma melophagium TaxID=715481 RepID=UPI00351A80FA|nr:Endonuclease/exonuclease/phosphatase [Trypanosoma melophagium]
MSTFITVLTYNLWGIFNSKHRTERMAHFATKVTQYDVILLQELFSLSDYEIIIQSLPEEVLATRYIRRFPTAFYGSGIAVISRFPIKSTLFFTFPLQGYPERVFHGDYYANKGAALIRIKVPCGPNKEKEFTEGSNDVLYKEVALYSTHLVAMYQKTARLRDWRHELYLPIRLSQAVSFANFIAETSRPNDCVVIGGDFNATQRSLEVQTMLILLRQRGFKFRPVLPSVNVYNACMQSNEQGIHASMLTFSDANMFNTTAEGWLVQGGDVPCQIDHIFYTSNTLRLCVYNDCPNAAPDYPVTVRDDDKDIPIGVVVFTRNDEVELPPEKGYLARFADWIRTKGQLTSCQGAITIANWISPEVKPLSTSSKLKTSLKATSSESGKNKRASCALSDHYGVAARLQLSLESSETDEIKTGITTKSVVLTAEELNVLREATKFLGESVKYMQYESKMCVYLGCASFALVLGNIFLSMYKKSQRERQTELLLERLVSIGTLHSTPLKSEVLNVESGDFTFILKQWVEKVISLNPFSSASTTTFTNTTIPTTTLLNNENVVEYAQVASFIHGRSLWQTLTPFFTIIGSIGGLSALIAGLLQRSADAKIMTEQVNTLRSTLPVSSEEREEEE